MGKARDLARLSPDSSGQLPDANLLALAANKLSGVIPDANAPSGSVIQVVNATITSGSSSTSSSTFVNTGFELSITPSNASSKIFVCFNFNQQGTPSPNMYSTIFRGSTNILNTDGELLYDNTSTNIHVPVSLIAVDSPNTTTSITYSLRHRSTTGVSNINTAYGAVTITLMEIAA